MGGGWSSVGRCICSFSWVGVVVLVVLLVVSIVWWSCRYGFFWWFYFLLLGVLWWWSVCWWWRVGWRWRWLVLWIVCFFVGISGWVLGGRCVFLRIGCWLGRLCWWVGYLVWCWLGSSKFSGGIVCGLWWLLVLVGFLVLLGSLWLWRVCEGFLGFCFWVLVVLLVGLSDCSVGGWVGCVCWLLVVGRIWGFWLGILWYLWWFFGVDWGFGVVGFWVGWSCCFVFFWFFVVWNFLLCLRYF